jgi:hypothetical protein
MASTFDNRWYVRDGVGGQSRQIWLIEDQTATNMSVTNPEMGAGTLFRAAPGETIWDCMRRQTPWFNPDVTEGHFHAMTLGPGEFYPRIARPIALAGNESRLWSPNLDGEKVYIASARGQLISLTRKLEIICQNVQPSERTFDVYGHEIRNLLILAATEAEMHWRGILVKNGSQSQRLSSKEFVKLVDPLKLSEYAITFYDFPDLQPIRPFAGWLEVDPTRSLGWYDAYNGVKHNREREFERGTLRHTFEAVSACIALLVAQFGLTALNAELSRSVTLKLPSWPIKEMYLAKMQSAAPTPVNHPSLSGS